jgi:hypothetical protein
MFALFQCCRGPYWGYCCAAVGTPLAGGHRQDSPLIIRVVCPTCDVFAEVIFDTSYTLAGFHREVQLGMRLLTQRHAELLTPIQVVPGHWTRVPAQCSSSFELTVALSSALNTHPLLSEATSTARGDVLRDLDGLSPERREHVEQSMHHRMLANACIGTPLADFVLVRFKRRFRPPAGW